MYMHIYVHMDVHVCVRIHTQALCGLSTYGEDPYTPRGIQAFAASLPQMRGLAELDMSFLYGIEPAEVALLAGSVGASRLASLKLEQNELSDAGADHLADALRTTLTLTHLDLAQVGLSTAGCEALARGLAANQSLTGLIMSHNSGIGAAGAAAVGEALRGNSTLTLLDAQQCGLCAEGVHALVTPAVEAANPTLRSLRVSGNECGEAGAVAFARLLRPPRRLQELALGGSAVGDAGAVAIGEALSASTTVAAVDLSSNRLSGEGAYWACMHAYACTHAHTHTHMCTSMKITWLGRRHRRHRARAAKQRCQPRGVARPRQPELQGSRALG